jgi:hypothetical protein
VRRSSATLTRPQLNTPDHQVVVVQHDRGTHDCRHQEPDDNKGDAERGGADEHEHESMKAVLDDGGAADLAGFTECSPRQ